MTNQPLLFRTGLREASNAPEQRGEPTLRDALPAVVELQAGVHIRATTRVTNIKLETTDDN